MLKNILKYLYIYIRMTIIKARPVKLLEQEFNILIMGFFVKEPLNEAGMVAKCVWCGKPVVGRGQGKIWLGSRQTYCSPRCQHEAEQAAKNK